MSEFEEIKYRKVYARSFRAGSPYYRVARHTITVIFGGELNGLVLPDHHHHHHHHQYFKVA